MNRLLLILVLMMIPLLFCKFDNSSIQKKKKFTNPILAGFYPDPSICKVDQDFYLVNSTFAYFPGIPIFHSKDLVNWKLIGHVMDRPEQMNLNGLGVSRGIFAPAIRYNKWVFYVTCTLVDAGGNFIVTSKNPAGPWSNPVWIPQINGIDPSMFFDENGKAYIVYNSIAPNNQPLYDGQDLRDSLALSPDDLRESFAEASVMVYACESQIFKGKRLQSGQSLFDRSLSRFDTFEK